MELFGPIGMVSSDLKSESIISFPENPEKAGCKTTWDSPHTTKVGKEKLYLYRYVTASIVAAYKDLSEMLAP